jgi:hypothetical protein
MLCGGMYNIKLESGLLSLMGLNFYHMLILDVGDVLLNDS